MSRSVHPLLALTKALRSDYSLSTIEKLVLVSLASFADASGASWPSMAKIARAASCSERAARMAVRRLVDLGWLAEERSAGGRSPGSAYASNRYTINPAPGAPIPDGNPAPPAPQPGTTCPPNPAPGAPPTRHLVPDKSSIGSFPNEVVHGSERERAGARDTHPHNTVVRRVRDQIPEHGDREAVAAWLDALDLPGLESDEGSMVGRWLDWHRDRGRPCADYAASWRRWRSKVAADGDETRGPYGTAPARREEVTEDAASRAHWARAASLAAHRQPGLGWYEQTNAEDV